MATKSKKSKSTTAASDGINYITASEVETLSQAELNDRIAEVNATLSEDSEKDAFGRIYDGTNWIFPEAEADRAEKHHAENYFNGSEWVPVPAGMVWDEKKGLIKA